MEKIEIFGYAKFDQRLYANAVDFLILAVAWRLLTLLSSLSGGIWLLAFVLGWLVSSAYNVVMHGLYGQTFGKMLLKIHVRLLDGQPITWSNALRRSSVELIAASLHVAVVVIAWRNGEIRLASSVSVINQSLAALPLLLPLRRFGDVWFWSELGTMLLNKKRRALHDYIGGTVVLRRQKQQDGPA